MFLAKAAPPPRAPIDPGLVAVGEAALHQQPSDTRAGQGSPARAAAAAERELRPLAAAEQEPRALFALQRSADAMATGTAPFAYPSPAYFAADQPAEIELLDPEIYEVPLRLSDDDRFDHTGRAGRRQPRTEPQQEDEQ